MADSENEAGPACRAAKLLTGPTCLGWLNLKRLRSHKQLQILVIYDKFSSKGAHICGTWNNT